MLSVVVPTRNRAQLLPGLLAAIDAQTHSDYEVIIVDDASEDDTSLLLSTWQTERHIVLRSERPLGSYLARNLGWRRGRGEIVAFTDDDCLPEPCWLANLASGFERSETVGVQGMTLPGPGGVTPFTHQIEQRRPGPPYRTCNIAYRRAVLEKLDGFEPLRWYADNVFGLRAARIGTIAFVPDAIVLHPPRPREWRHRHAWRARFDADAVHRRFLRELGEERMAPVGRALPIVLWIARPLVKQSFAHARYALRHPGRYLREMRPMIREKRELLEAMGESWRDRAPRGAASLEPLLSNSLVSVVIVTRDRPDSLRLTLEALGRQTYGNREVIVVDHSKSTIARSMSERFGARWIDAAHPSPPASLPQGARGVPSVTLAAARQAGVDTARGDIIAFTDDDCLPQPDWIEALSRAFGKHPDLLGVQGRTEAERDSVGCHTIRVSKPNRLYRTCNIAYRRDALDHAGGFDERFSGWFEDTALGSRVERHGRIGYADDAIVIHRAMPRLPLDRTHWRRLLSDEKLLASEYPDFYRRVRGPSVYLVVIGRWLVGSPLKTLLRELPGGTREPKAYLALLQSLLAERLELVRAVLRRK